MKTPTAQGVGATKPDILTDIVARVITMGATRFEVNQDYDQGEVWAVKGPLELSVATFPADSPKATGLRKKLHHLKAKPANMVVDGSEYLLGIEIFNSTDHEEFEVTVTPSKEIAASQPGQ